MEEGSKVTIGTGELKSLLGFKADFEKLTKGMGEIHRDLAEINTRLAAAETFNAPLRGWQRAARTTLVGIALLFLSFGSWFAMDERSRIYTALFSNRFYATDAAPLLACLASANATLAHHLNDHHGGGDAWPERIPLAGQARRCQTLAQDLQMEMLKRATQ